MGKGLRMILACQAVYYLATGLWPILEIGSFQLVTGPKTDLWLVRMVGLLVMAIGVTLGYAVIRARRSPEIIVLSLSSIFAFTAIDVFYSMTGVISRIYLADAAVELALAAGIVVTLRLPFRQ